MGLLDNLDDPKNQALLVTALSLLSGAPGRNKNFGADVGNAGIQGLLSYNQAQRNQQVLAGSRQEQTLRDFQIKQAQQAQTDQDHFRALFQPQGGQATAGDSAPPVGPPAMPQGMALPGQQPQVPQGFAAPGPARTPPMMASGPNSKQSRFDAYNAMADKLEAGGLPEKAMQYRELALKFQPKLKDENVRVDAQGRPVIVRNYEDGRTEESPYQPTAKTHWLDAGGQQIPVDEYTNKRGPGVNKTMSPDSVASNAVAWYNARKGSPFENADGTVSWVTPPSGGGAPGVTPIPGLNSGKNQPSEAELTAAGFATRMGEAEKILGALGTTGLPTTSTFAASNIPTKNPMIRRAAERMAMTPEQQQYRQAQEDWVRAKLRKESGAVIGEDEMQREIEMYFPQLGEMSNQKVIEQKAKSRQTAMAAMGMMSGKAASRIPKNESVDDLVKRYLK